MLKRELLLAGCAIALMLSGQEANAAEACTKVPTCAELGYTETDCNGLVSLKCPFDQSKLFCGMGKCETGYYQWSATECVLGNRQVIKSGSTVIGVAVSDHLALAITEEKDVPWDIAVNMCKNKTTGGKSWRLPTKDELVAMSDTYKTTRATIGLNGGDVAFGCLWSSTADNRGLVSGDLVWAIYPSSGKSCTSTIGGDIGSEKTRARPVRCVFSF